MKKRRLKLKKQVWYFLIFIFFIIAATIWGVNYYQEYKYKQTNEYKLLQIGYTKKEINILEKTLNEQDIHSLLSKKKNDDLLKFIDEDYFIYHNLSDYLAYKQENQNTSYPDIVSIVNVHRNSDYYTNDHDAKVDYNYNILVNKYYKLASDYEPEDLVAFKTDYAWGNYGDNKARKEVYDAFIQMHDSAKESGITLMVNSSYRSYQDQEAVYNDYKDTYDVGYADKIAARPGYSEHQTGLALDIFCTTNTSTKTFANSDAYQWLLANAHKFGFILRYPENKENITGYDFESWHYRYVGTELALKIYNENITFDEYYAYYLN